MNEITPVAPVYVFGAYRLDPVARVLTRDGVPIALPARLFETLLVLVRGGGEVVGRDALLAAVWRGRVVDETNLKQTIFQLRRALGEGADRLIKTVPSHGYVLACAVRVETAGEPPREAPARRRGWKAAAAGLAAVLALGVGWRWVARLPSVAPAHSVAVLPFRNLTGDGGQAYVAEGLADELIGALARLPGLRVAARTSTGEAARAGGDLGEIARRLRVGAVLEGSVRRAGAHLRVEAALVDAASGGMLWARDYDRDGGDLLQVQREIAGSVVAALRAPLLGEEVRRLTAGGTENGAAFDAYLRGSHTVAVADNPAGWRAALPDLERAIALDADFALARVARARVLLALANAGAGGDAAAVRQGVKVAAEEARRAVAAAPSLGAAHLVLGAALLSLQEMAAGDREITIAYSLAPGDAGVALDYALTQGQFGRVARGIAAAEAVTALEPLRGQSYAYLASLLIVAHRDAAARDALRRARLLGDAVDADAGAMVLALRAGDFAGALRSCGGGEDWPALECRAVALHGLGRRGAAEAALAALRSRMGDTGAFQFAQVYAQWGDAVAATAWLRTAYRLHDTGLVLMKSDPLLEPIRGSAAYREVAGLLRYPD